MTETKRLTSVVFIAVLSFAILFMLSGCDSEETKAAKESFNAEIERVQSEYDALQKEIEIAEELSATEEIPLDESLIPTLENEIANAKTVEFTAPTMPSGLEGILEKTKEFESVSFKSEMQILKDAEQALNDSIEQMKLVTNPSEAFVIERLQGVDGVSDIAAVTEENDPNGQLNKAGGYTATIYFASPLVDQSQIYKGPSIIDRGTDGGGSIEVYSTIEEASRRNDYLAAFDGSIFASGSHKVIGTVVVRTSNELTASQQGQLEAAIIASLIRLD